MPALQTERLWLCAQPRGQLLRWLRGDATLADAPGVALADGVLNEVVLRAMSAKVEKMHGAAAESHVWYTYWRMQLQAAPLVVGLLGYKGAPNRQGEVEIGYGMAPAYRGQGYMTEAVRALVDWALAQPGCRGVRALTLPDNVASQRVLQKVGLVLVQRRENALVWRVAGS